MVEKEQSCNSAIVSKSSLSEMAVTYIWSTLKWLFLVCGLHCNLRIIIRLENYEVQLFWNVTFNFDLVLLRSQQALINFVIISSELFEHQQNHRTMASICRVMYNKTTPPPKTAAHPASVRHCLYGSISWMPLVVPGGSCRSGSSNDHRLNNTFFLRWESCTAAYDKPKKRLLSISIFLFSKTCFGSYNSNYCMME